MILFGYQILASKLSNTSDSIPININISKIVVLLIAPNSIIEGIKSILNIININQGTIKIFGKDHKKHESRIKSA